MRQHTQKVEKIQREMREKNGRISLCHQKPSNTLRHTSGNIDVSALNEILEIDEKNLTATVEPRVTLYQLVQTTLKKGLVPLVVPEFTSITVGGAIMGAALESSSHRYGQFNDTCLETELLLGDGTKIVATPEENSDLFWGISGSYGTLAILTAAKIRLQKAPSHVLLEYHHFDSAEEIAAFLSQATEDFVEGICLSEKKFVAITATFSDANLPVYSPRHYFSKWFVQHVSETKDRTQELMPLKDYLFRLDRGGFWVGGYLLKKKLLLKTLFRFDLKNLVEDVKKEHISINPSLLSRLFFGWAMSSEKLYKIWHKVPKEILENLYFVQDFYAPEEKFRQVFNSFQKQTGIFPIWLCPLKGSLRPQFLSPHFGKERFINIGLYGIPQGKNLVTLTQALEKEIADFGGRKMLYSYTYYSQEDFSKIYHQELYEELRNKYHATGRFPSLYEKVSS